MLFPLPLISLIWLSWSTHQCLAQIEQSASFFYNPPSGGTNVTLGSRVIVNWTTDWAAGVNGGSPRVSLAVYQANGAGRFLSAALLNNVVDPGNYVWEAQPVESLPISNGFHFCLWLGPQQASVDFSKTLYINSGDLFIVSGEASSTVSQSMPATSSSSQPERTSTSSLIRSSSTTIESRTQHPPSSSPTVASGPSGEGGQLSKTQSVATIVGSVIGALCAVVTALGTWWGFRKNKKGDRVIPETVRRFHRSVSRRRDGTTVGLFADVDGRRGRRGNHSVAHTA